MLQLLPIQRVEETVVNNISQRTERRSQSYTRILFQQLQKSVELVSGQVNSNGNANLPP